MAPMEKDNGFGGKDFSNNLLSDLAPLLSLFGEQVTKQFLSLSLGWADHILLGMGPIGILTIVVSTIRVAGSPLLKSLVGRSREEKAVVEQELLSSTSNDVCEMWNGNGIVRTKGRPPKTMKTLIITAEGRILTLERAVSDGIYRDSFPRWRLEARMPSFEVPPSLPLNVRSRSAESRVLWGLAAFGVLIQLGALVVSGIATYIWHFTPLEPGNPAPQYGYPLYSGGSLVMFAGVIACRYIIESSTKESYLTCDKKYRDKVAVVRMQEPCRVADQDFPGVLLFNPRKNPDIVISYGYGENMGSLFRLRRLKFLTLLATIVTMGGFVAQFIGLRNLDWTISIIQLAVTLIMTLIRAYVRRGLSDDVPCLRAPKITSRPLAKQQTLWPWFLYGVLSIAEDPEHSIDLLHWEHPSTSYVQLCLGWLQPEWSRDLKSTPSAGLAIKLPFLNPQMDVRGAQENKSWYWKLDLLRQLKAAMNDAISSEVTQNARRVETAGSAVLENIRNTHAGLLSWREDSSLLVNGQLAAPRDLIWTTSVVQFREDFQSGPGRSDRVTRVTVNPVRISLERISLEDTGQRVTDLEVLLFYCRFSQFFPDVHSQRVMYGTFGYNPYLAVDSRRFARIVGTNPPHENCQALMLSQWINRPLNGHELPVGGNEIEAEDPILRDSEINTNIFAKIPWPYFGMYLSSLTYPGFSLPEGPVTDCGELPRLFDSELVIEDRHETTDLLQMARELFSLFILALAAEVKEVRGITTRTPERRWANTFFDALGNEAVKAGLAVDLDDALTLVIPAFARYNLLPREYTPQNEEDDRSSPNSNDNTAAQGGSESSGVRRRGTLGVHEGEGADDRPSN